MVVPKAQYKAFIQKIRGHLEFKDIPVDVEHHSVMQTLYKGRLVATALYAKGGITTYRIHPERIR